MNSMKAHSHRHLRSFRLSIEMLDRAESPMDLRIPLTIARVIHLIMRASVLPLPPEWRPAPVCRPVPAAKRTGMGVSARALYGAQFGIIQHAGLNRLESLIPGGRWP